MDYQEALKQIRSKKDTEGFLVIKFAYDKEIIMPHKDGLTLIASLVSAEELRRSYGSPPEVKALAMDSITVTPMNRKEYEQHKIAALLKVSLNDLMNMEATQ